MASQLESKQASAAHDGFVQRQIADVCRRIRRAEIGSVLLLLGVVVCGYALAAGLLDLLVPTEDRTWPVVLRRGRQGKHVNRARRRYSLSPSVPAASCFFF